MALLVVTCDHGYLISVLVARDASVVCYGLASACGIVVGPFLLNLDLLPAFLVLRLIVQGNKTWRLG